LVPTTYLGECPGSTWDGEKQGEGKNINVSIKTVPERKKGKGKRPKVEEKRERKKRERTKVLSLTSRGRLKKKDERKGHGCPCAGKNRFQDPGTKEKKKVREQAVRCWVRYFSADNDGNQKKGKKKRHLKPTPFKSGLTDTKKRKGEEEKGRCIGLTNLSGFAATPVAPKKKKKNLKRPQTKKTGRRSFEVTTQEKRKKKKKANTDGYRHIAGARREKKKKKCHDPLIHPSPPCITSSNESEKKEKWETITPQSSVHQEGGRRDFILFDPPHQKRGFKSATLVPNTKREREQTPAFNHPLIQKKKGKRN